MFTATDVLEAYTWAKLNLPDYFSIDFIVNPTLRVVMYLDNYGCLCNEDMVEMKPTGEPNCWEYTHQHTVTFDEIKDMKILPYYQSGADVFLVICEYKK